MEKTSLFLINTLKSHPEQYLTIGELLELLRRRSYGALLIMLSLAGLIPGISFFAAVADFLLGLQIALGFHAPRLPNIIQKQRIHREKTLKFTQEVMPWLERIEEYVKPRWEPLSSANARRVIGAMICVLAAIAILPLPFINFLPNFAIICLALGIIERDGLCLLIGSAIALMAMWISQIMVRMAWNSLMLAL
ncbi:MULTISPECIES: exopolysaccharide biosynthesis protein [Vibrio]|uniref:exopolysaccharide biosynthesis protein n=1 Tax=Vibrio TaxID=662 RepID=UPI001F336A4B|nr:MULTISPECIES: exopolysaccharide biosynthesis protein [Vibrio]MCF7362430.1 exopolysaccharide biosynthesis protein [Vibrio sp. A1-b2]MCZ4371717.1 exopolysaccharide biosynthesis protein [Vibrio diazotrophicus]